MHAQEVPLEKLVAGRHHRSANVLEQALVGLRREFAHQESCILVRILFIVYRNINNTKTLVNLIGLNANCYMIFVPKMHFWQSLPSTPRLLGKC